MTSTILNEHHEYEYSSKLMNIGQNNLNLESIHSSNKVTKSILYERNESKPVKLNFKKVIKQGEKNFKTAYKPKSKKNIHEANKQLLRTFFDAN